jgi:long-chain acyl-CoA synthetase
LLYFDFGELIKEGSKLLDISNDKIEIGLDDVYTFSYTSGTTGPPKGAMITNKNLLANISTLISH